ncbi:CpaF family protein [Curtobacterium sp. PsM8]|uniref:CpaF family protein n=1 Tax=Curtobacterium sp. PsM8 TaxID=3030532 RepID=UPI00263B8EBF|nr:ATPase, T2SS/T4P/T4SS family [Curtobacterium sp. PsM8]MDN4648167.1 ATPase, T2SS/T4P/T4SS family [Curtobacterium sp. PsM8]
MHRHRAPFLPGTPRPEHRRQAAALVDFEELAPLVADDRVTDVLVLGGRGVWTDRGGALTAVSGLVLSERRTRDLARALVARGGRHVDETTPCADVRHGDGIRVHVVLAPVSVLGTTISIRLPQNALPTIDRLADGGFFQHVPRAVVDRAVQERRNVLITGATGSGKTTLLAAMLGSVPTDERIVTVEDVAELRIDHPHVVALEARQANAEGAGALGTERLLREALRMRPDRIVVGECRGAEIRELTSALNTGHDGGAGTVHANGVGDVAARLEALGALAGLGPESLARQAASAFDLVLHVERRNGVRRLAEVGRFGVDRQGRLEVVPVPVSESGAGFRPGRGPAAVSVGASTGFEGRGRSGSPAGVSGGERARRARVVPARPEGDRDDGLCPVPASGNGSGVDRGVIGGAGGPGGGAGGGAGPAGAHVDADTGHGGAARQRPRAAGGAHRRTRGA